MSTVPLTRFTSSICVSDASKRVILTSDAHLSLLGRKREQVVGRSWQEWIPGDASRLILPKFEKLVANKKPYEVIAHLIRADGAAIPFFARCSIVAGETVDKDLVFIEIRALDMDVVQRTDENFRCAEFVRDISYELAAYAGRHKLRQLTESLIQASATAEEAIDMLSRVAEEVKG